MFDQAALRQLLDRSLRAVASFWQSLPAVWRFLWLLLCLLPAIGLVRSAWSGSGSLPAAPVLACVALVGAIGVASRLANAQWRGAVTWRTRWLDAMTAVPLMLCLAAVLPRLSAFGAGATLTLALNALAITVFWDALASPLPCEFSTQAESWTSSAVIDAQSAPEGDEDSLLGEADPCVLQQTTRSVTPDGCTILIGMVRVDLSSGQKVASIHLPVFPPFASVPEVTCASLAATDVRTTVATALPYGVRFELRRGGRDLPAERAEVQFTIRAAGADSTDETRGRRVS